MLDTPIYTIGSAVQADEEQLALYRAFVYLLAARQMGKPA